MSALGRPAPDRIGPFDTRIDAEFIRAYAEATGDDNRVYSTASAVPPLAIASRVFQAQLAGMDALVPEGVWKSASGGVHGEHDVVLHRPIVPGEALVTYVEGYNARPFKDNLRVVFRHVTLDAQEQPVADQLWTTVLLGTTAEPYGPDTPDHTFPEDARQRLLFEDRTFVDRDMIRRYAEVSGDFSAHHFEGEAARRSGAESVFLHGLCTMGLCARAAVRALAGGDPCRVRRVAVRFGSPVLVDRELHVHLYGNGPATAVFEATAAGAPSIRNGRVEIEAG